MRFFSVLWEYLETSSIHGLNYIHPRNHWISRLLWLIITTVGFMASAKFISDSFADWEEDPIVTTMDSIAAPIKELQFPTVTVCPQNNKPPDNWAALEILLNFVAFECGKSQYDVSLPPCDITKDVRQDFGYFLENTLRPFIATLDESNISLSYTANLKFMMSSAILETEVMPQLASFLEIKAIDEGYHQTTNEMISFTEEWMTANLLAKYFGHGRIPLWEILETLMNQTITLDDTDDSYFGGLLFGSYYDDYYEDSSDDGDCASEDCKEILSVVRKYFRVLSECLDVLHGLPFGSFLLNTLPANSKYGDGGKNPPFSSFAVTAETRAKWEYQGLIHDYFADLSRAFGFSANENVSLYDLPQILATPDMARYNGSHKLNPDRSFWYTRRRYFGNASGEVQIKCKIHWLNYIHKSKQPHPCKLKNGNCCTNKFGSYTKFIGNNLKAIMKVMRFAAGRAKPYLNIKNVLEKAKKWIKYPMSINESNLESLALKYDVMAMIHFCTLNRKDHYDCDFFNPVVTDAGICHSFNPTKPHELLKKSYYSESFLDAYNDDISNNVTLFNGTGNGMDHSLNFFLLDTSFRRVENDYEPNLYSFELLLSSKDNYFNINRGSQRLNPGKHTIWKIQAMEDIPSEALQTVSFAKRKCKFSDETEGLEIFKVYSQTACEFECQIKKAYEICLCYPWYIPTPAKQTRHILCDVDGNFCFDQVMNRQDLIDECTCLPSCHKIEFQHTEYVYPLDWNCDYKDKDLLSLMEQMFNNGYNSFTYSYLERENWNQTKARQDLCQKIVNHISKVTIMFDRKTYVRTRTNLKVTFTDKLAAFGGTLGLFTGMSILSMIEAIFWLLRLIKQTYSPRRINQRKGHTI